MNMSTSPVIETHGLAKTYKGAQALKPLEKSFAMKRTMLCLVICTTILALVLTGCSPRSTSQPPAPTPEPATPALGSSRLVVEPEAITRVDELLTQMTHDGTFTGSVLIAQDGKVLLSKGYGLADRAQGIANTPQTRFHLGSMSKQFTAMAILILQARGKLNVQDPICNYFADCPAAWRDITIHHLLTHTSGLSSEQSSKLYSILENAVGNPAMPSDPAYFLGLARELPLDTRPGELFSYNNVGYILLAHIIEEVSGQSFTAFLEQAIFSPLNMQDTGYEGRSSGVAKLYAGRYDTTAAEYDPLPISDGTGGLYSSAEDLFLWDQALYTDRLLPRGELELLFEPFVHEVGDKTPGMPATLGFGYGYGWFLGEFLGHPVVVGAGGGPTFSALIIRYSEDELVVIILTNQEGIDWSVWPTISKALFGEQ